MPKQTTQQLRQAQSVARKIRRDLYGPRKLGPSMEAEAQQAREMKQSVFPSTPKQGDVVWVNFFTCDYRGTRDDLTKIGQVKASVQKRLFDHEERNYLGKLNDVRWILVQPGRPYQRGYGMAWKPEHCFDCQLAAEKNLQNRMLAKISEIEDMMKQLEIW